MKTTGIYVYGSDFDVQNKNCDLHVEAQVRSESGDSQSIVLSAIVVNADGIVCTKFESEASDLVSEQTEAFTASGKLADAQFWSDAEPYLYDVYTARRRWQSRRRMQDATGFRKAELKGGAGSGGVWLNGRFVWLTGYSQRSVNDWAGLARPIRIGCTITM